MPTDRSIDRRSPPVVRPTPSPSRIHPSRRSPKPKRRAAAAPPRQAKLAATPARDLPLSPDERVRTVLWVHGMGATTGEFFHDLFPRLIQGSQGDAAAESLRHEEVLYEPDNEAVAQKIRDVDAGIGSFMEKEGAKVSGSSPQDLASFGDGVKGAIGDVGGLVMSTGARRLVLERFIQKLQDIMLGIDAANVPRRSHTIDIVCHSLGTFVTYELLHFLRDPVAGLGLQPNDDVKIRNVFLLAPVMALIRSTKVFGTVQGTTDMATAATPFTKPFVIDSFSHAEQPLVERVWGYRHVLDPFASIVITDGQFMEGGTPMTFTKLHAGANTHAYTNYLDEFHDQMLGEILK